MPKMLLLYLHGFNSSPQSVKAQQISQWFQKYHPNIKLAVPHLAPYPTQAWQQIEAIIAEYGEYQIGVVGSSLGGYLATRVSQQLNCPAVLINPAVKPYELLVAYLGDNSNLYTGDSYTLVPEHIDELRALDCVQLTHPEMLWALLQTDDEVLDYRQAVEKYQASKVTVEQGGDHSFVNFERHFNDIVTFLAFNQI